MSDRRDISLKFYHFLCGKIGTPDVVTARRRYFISKDRICSSKYATVICSGSKAEGLDMKTSDYDIMYLANKTRIIENLTEQTNHEPCTFVMVRDNTKPGFTQLKLCSFMCHDECRRALCTSYGQDYFLSSEKTKNWFLSDNTKKRLGFKTIHGPCISTDDEKFDFAYCFRCKTWIERAQNWVTRSKVWPLEELVAKIISYGVFFVSIGCKTSRNEDTEWRISFSVAEKQLIFSFTHTKLLCYALLKIVLKEIIEKHASLKGLLCSYFLKTIVFWLSEEASLNAWQPDKIISCFMNCLRRLFYCVKYSILPHYFITDNNLFEDRFNSQEGRKLNSLLTELYQRGPSLLMYSESLSDFFLSRQRISDPIFSSRIDNFIDQFNAVLRLHIDCYITFISEDFLNVLVHKTKHNSLTFLGDFFEHCQRKSKELDVTFISGYCNKTYHQKYKQYLPYFILGLQTDAVSGWLYLATYFYCSSQYKLSLTVTEYVLSKCTPDKIYHFDYKLTCEHLHDIEPEAITRHMLDMDGVHRLHKINGMYFEHQASLIPFELKDEWSLRKPPVVYAHFLNFLCFYKVSQYRNCRDSLRALELTAEDDYLISGDGKALAESYNCLGIAYYMLGQLDSARTCFVNSVRLDKEQERYVNWMLSKISK